MDAVNERNGDGYEKEFLFIRHAQSTKNAEDRYASINGEEPLTLAGYQQIQKMIALLEQKYPSAGDMPLRLISASEVRCRETAAAIGKHFGIQIEIEKKICSFSDESTSGQNISEAHKANDNLGRQIELYKAGLLSAQKVPWPAGSIKILENRIRGFIEGCLNYSERNIWIVAHKSSITCMTIILLRKYHDYPLDFYGYIDIPVGTGISIKVGKDKPEINLVRFENA